MYAPVEVDSAEALQTLQPGGLLFTSCTLASCNFCPLLCRSVVEQYMGKKFEAFKPLPAWKYEDYLGWHEQGDGKLWYGVYVQVRVLQRCWGSIQWRCWSGRFRSQR